MIVKATDVDSLKISKLAKKLWINHSVTELEEQMAELVNRTDSVIFLMEKDGNPIGFAQCELRKDYVEGTKSKPVGYLEGIYIEPDHRKKGYARQLLNACEKWAKDKGCVEFASDCEIDNDDSLAFHLQMGFKEANRIICFTKNL